MSETTETVTEMQERVSEKLAAADAAVERAPEMTGAEAKALIEKAMAKADAEGRDRIDAIKAVPPIAFTARIKDGVDLSDEAAFLAPSVEIMPVVNPLFHALLTQLGATPDGARSYKVSAGAKADPRTLGAIMEVIPGPICYTPAHTDKGDKNGFRVYNAQRYKVYGDLYYGFRETEAGRAMAPAAYQDMKYEHPDEGPLAGAAVIINNGSGQLFIKVCTNRQDGRGGLYFTDDELSPCMDRLRSGARLEPQDVTPDQAITVLEEAAAQGYSILDPTGDLKLLRGALSSMVVAQRVPGSPGEARLVVGAKVDTSAMSGIDAVLSAPDPSRSTRTARLPAKIAAAAVHDAQSAGATATVLDRHVLDVIRMAEAVAADIEVADPSITPREYQRVAVGLHLATEVGYLQAASPGLGKSACALWGMAGWAQRALDAASAPAQPAETDTVSPQLIAQVIEAAEVLAQAEAVTGTVQTLSCGACGQDWQRPAKRGRKPSVCPDCK